MIHSIGIDLVESKRVERSINRFGTRFAERILGKEEMKIFNSRNDKVGFLAGRFAAKEAVIKSLGKFLKTRPAYTQIEILNDQTGHPYLIGQNEVKKVFEGKKCLLSISHERNFATAVAMITEG